MKPVKKKIGSAEIMTYRGELVSTAMTKQRLIEIIVELGQSLEETQGRASRYLRVANPKTLLEESESQ